MKNFLLIFNCITKGHTQAEYTRTMLMPEHKGYKREKVKALDLRSTNW